MENTIALQIDSKNFFDKLDEYILVVNTCLGYATSGDSLCAACSFLNIEIKNFVGRITSFAEAYTNNLPLRSDETRKVNWNKYLNGIEKWQDFLLEKARDIDNKILLYLEKTFEQITTSIKTIIRAKDTDEAEAYVSYWQRELEHYTADGWTDAREEINRQIRLKSEWQRPGFYEKKIAETLKTLRELAVDAVNEKNMCVYEERLGRLLWSESLADDGGNFDRLLLNIKALQFYCEKANKPIAIIGVEHVGDSEEDELLEEIDKARRCSVPLGKKATEACAEYLAPEFRNTDLSKLWDDLLSSDIGYELAARLNKSAGRDLVICTVIGALHQHKVFTCKTVDVVDRVFGVLHGNEHMSRAERETRKKTFASNMTPSKLCKEPAIVEAVVTNVGCLMFNV